MSSPSVVLPEPQLKLPPKLHHFPQITIKHNTPAISSDIEHRIEGPTPAGCFFVSQVSVKSFFAPWRNSHQFHMPVRRLNPPIPHQSISPNAPMHTHPGLGSILRDTAETRHAGTTPTFHFPSKAVFPIGGHMCSSQQCTLIPRGPNLLGGWVAACTHAGTHTDIYSQRKPAFAGLVASHPSTLDPLSCQGPAGPVVRTMLCSPVRSLAGLRNPDGGWGWGAAALSETHVFDSPGPFSSLFLDDLWEN